MPIIKATKIKDERALERRIEVVRLRAQGVRNKEIAERMGVSQARISQMFSEGMQYMTEQLAIEAAQIRILEVERLEGLIQELLEHRKVTVMATKDGDPIVIDNYPNLEIYDRIFKAIGQKGKMLGIEIIAKEEGENRLDRADAPWQKFIADVIEFEQDVQEAAPKELEAPADDSAGVSH